MPVLFFDSYLLASSDSSAEDSAEVSEEVALEVDEETVVETVVEEVFANDSSFLDCSMFLEIATVV